MLVVIEGCDATGKTTLARQVVERGEAAGLSTEYRHYGEPKRHPLEEYVEQVEQALDRADLVVCDRLHWGELVYGPLYRGKTVLGRPGLDHVNLYLRSRGAAMVMLTGKSRKLRQRHERLGEDYLKPGDVESVIRAFDTVRRNSRDTLDSEVFDTTRGSSPWPSPEHIIQRARQRHNLTAMTRKLWPGYIGPAMPKVLLLGDRRTDEHPAPFAPRHGTCGRFLFEAIPFWSGGIGLVNVGDLERVQPLWRAIGAPRLVALGGKASAALEDEELDHHLAPHPRDFGGSLEEYASEVLP